MFLKVWSNVTQACLHYYNSPEAEQRICLNVLKWRYWALVQVSSVERQPPFLPKCSIQNRLKQYETFLFRSSSAPLLISARHGASTDPKRWWSRNDCCYGNDLKRWYFSKDVSVPFATLYTPFIVTRYALWLRSAWIPQNSSHFFRGTLVFAATCYIRAVFCTLLILNI